MPSRNPLTWDEYEGRPSPSGGSVTSSQLADEQALLDDDVDGYDAPGGLSHHGRRRYASLFRISISTTIFIFHHIYLTLK